MMVVPEGGSLLAAQPDRWSWTGTPASSTRCRWRSIYEDVKQLWSASKTGYTPTLIVAYGGLMGENYWYQKTNVWEDERLLVVRAAARAWTRAAGGA